MEITNTEKTWNTTLKKVVDLLDYSCASTHDEKISLLELCIGSQKSQCEGHPLFIFTVLSHCEQTALALQYSQTLLTMTF